MPASAIRLRACPESRRKARNPQIVSRTQLVPLAAAREVLDEASRWLGVTLPSRYAVRLASHAHLIYANSPSFRRALARPGDAARDRLYVFLRHWLAARLHAERPALYARLPRTYSTGEPLSEVTPIRASPLCPSTSAHGFAPHDHSTTALFV